ncbi:hypothetical protein J3459_015968 [Metarhizium acridum]|nr:hypothetical protein J3459_015968 [Metarhizium acridum]
MTLHQYDYVFAIGTFFALLDAFNNGANDVANSWATSVSSRSISYRQAMIFGTVFEMLGAITVGARTAETIKNGIIPNSAFQNNAGVQMLAFTCALAAASSWVMWCTRHSAHVSSTYSLISAVAGVGVATVGASKVQWGWNDGKGLGAIFAGLGMAPFISGGFAATIFMLVKLVKPAWYIAAVTMGTGGGVAILAAIFFVPFVHAKVIKKDPNIQWWHFIYGPLLFKRPAPEDAERANVPNYAVVQHDDDDLDESVTHSPKLTAEDGPGKEHGIMSTSDATKGPEKSLANLEATQKSYKELVAEGEARFNARLMKKRGPLGWAMRTLRDNPMGAGQIYTGIEGTPDGERMKRVYAAAEKYPNEVEHTYSFVQVLTACTASFAHGANDIGNSVGPWAVIYGAWKTGNAAQAKAPVDVWQLAVLSATISVGLITYGYNIMKG